MYHFTLLLQVICVSLAFYEAQAEAPPGYVKPPEIVDQHPPKYEYAYNIEDLKGRGQGKLEARDGIYALGRYYVQGKDAKQSVQYYADDWGYHPLVEYSNVGPHSKSRAQLLLGVEAVKAVAFNKFAPSSVPPNQHVLQSIEKFNQNKQASPSSSLPTHQALPLVSSNQPEILVQQQPQQQILVQKQQHQVLVTPQPQVYVQEQQHLLVTPQPQVNVVHQQQKVLLQEQQPQQILVQQQNVLLNQHQDESALIQENAGGFGTKISIQHLPSQTATKVFDVTKQLVSGEDVLNINSAGSNQYQEIESVTVSSQNLASKSTVSEFKTSSEVQNVEINEEVSYSSTTPSGLSLLQQPIIVSDELYTKQEEKIGGYQVTEPSSVLVTPRYVTANFNQEKIVENSNLKIENTGTNVQVQESIPFYLGKYEYNQPAQSYSQLTSIHKNNQEQSKTILALPQLPQIQAVVQQQPPDFNVHENFVEVDQKNQQQHYVEKIVEKPVPVIQTQIIREPYEVTKYINKPYPVQVPVEVEKPIPYPVQVEKIVEKPVHITKIVEKPVPQPYPVEKIVERPVKVPYEVTRYVDRPYPVKVPYAQPVPYAVEKVVEKIVRQPYPVRVPVEVRVPYPVEKIVEKQVQVPQYIEKQVPVERIVEKPVHKYIDRPYPVEVKVPVPQPYLVEVPKTYYAPSFDLSNKFSSSIKIKQDQKQELSQTDYRAVYTPPKQKLNEYLAPVSDDKGYLPPAPKPLEKGYLPAKLSNCDHNSQSSQLSYHTIKNDDYIGLIPPKVGNNGRFARKFRSPRSSFNSNLRLEYGFMPPLIPSQEIDIYGNPIENN